MKTSYVIGIVASIFVFVGILLTALLLTSHSGGAQTTAPASTSSATTSTPDANSTPTPGPTPQPLILNYLDAPGNDITGSPLSNISSAVQCLTMCTSTSGCKGVAYGPSQQQCWLKSAMAKLAPSGSDTNLKTLGFTSPSPGNQLASNASLASDQFLVTPFNDYALLMQSDNNLVLYSLSNGKAVWASNTSGKGVGSAYATLQRDSNLVVNDASNNVLWSTNLSAGSDSPYTLTLGTTGSLVITDTNNKLIWTSGTGAQFKTGAPSTPPPGYTGTPAVVVMGNISGPQGMLILDSSKAGQAITFSSRAITSVSIPAGYTLVLTGTNGYYNQPGPLNAAVNLTGVSSVTLNKQ